jgi:type IV secretory pathway TrbL component
MRREQTMGQGVTAAASALRSGDQGGSGHSIDLSQGE